MSVFQVLQWIIRISPPANPKYWCKNKIIQNLNNCVAFLEFGWPIFFIFHSLCTKVSAKAKKKCARKKCRTLYFITPRETMCALCTANYEYLKDNWMLFWTMKASAFHFLFVRFFFCLSDLIASAGGLKRKLKQLNRTFMRSCAACVWNAFHLYSIEIHIHCAFFCFFLLLLLLFRCLNLMQLLIFVWKWKTKRINNIVWLFLFCVYRKSQLDCSVWRGV